MTQGEEEDLAQQLNIEATDLPVIMDSKRSETRVSDNAQAPNDFSMMLYSSNVPVYSDQGSDMENNEEMYDK